MQTYDADFFDARHLTSLTPSARSSEIALNDATQLAQTRKSGSAIVSPIDKSATARLISPAALSSLSALPTPLLPLSGIEADAADTA